MLAHPKEIKAPNIQSSWTINKNKPRGNIIAVNKVIPTEDTPQSVTHNIQILAIKTKTVLSLTIGAAYDLPLPPN